MLLKITTWNINSVRLRLPLLFDLMEKENPDVICLQETKCPNEAFPEIDIRAKGYEHIYYMGHKGYNGVAILSKIPFKKTESFAFCSEKTYSAEQQLKGRYVAVTLENDVEVHNFYVPAGGDEPDISVNPKFACKLDYLTEMTAYFDAKKTDQDKIVLVGDLNIAPFEHDVWSSKQLRNVISHTQIEKDHMDVLYKTLDWVDVCRHFTPMDEKLFTWWSYRNRDWKKSNRGRRLDHIWVTPALKETLQSFTILPEARDWTKPSDHIPVSMEIKL